MGNRESRMHKLFYRFACDARFSLCQYTLNTLPITLSTDIGP